MLPEVAAACMKDSLRDLDASWTTCPKTLRRARLLELSGWAFYVAGRGGVLGDDVRPETVAAAIGLIAPDAVRAGWEAARKVGPGAVAASRLAECARWGDEHLATMAGVDYLASLAERVVAAADVVAMPLFAAWRAAPVPDGGDGARAAVLAHLLYEHRAGALLVAMRACRLGPVETIIGGPEGAEEALAFGWHPPFPARMPLLRRYAYVDALANRVTGAACATLSATERTEFVHLLRAAAIAGRSP